MYQSGYREDLDLLADIIGKKNADKVAESFAFKDLDGIGEGLLVEKGLSVGASHKLLASLELGKRVSEDLARDNPINDSESAYQLYKQTLATAKQEAFLVVCVNEDNHVTGEKMIAKGTATTCDVAPLDVLHFVVQECSSRIFLFHNHPSGDTNPSKKDTDLTDSICQGADLLGITVLDHIIIGRSTFSSFKDLGLLPVNTVKLETKKAASKKATPKKETKEPVKKPAKKRASKKAMGNAEFMASRGASPVK